MATIVPDFVTAYTLALLDATTKQVVGAIPATADAGALQYLGAYPVPNPDPTKPDVWAVDQSKVPALARASAIAYNQSLGLCNADGTPTAALTAALSGSGGGSSVPVTGITLASAGNATTLAVNGSLQLTATVAPSNATNKALTWTTSDNTKVSVDQTGLLGGVAATSSSVTITATAKDGSGKSATFVITSVTAATGVSIRKLLSTDLASGNDAGGQALTQNKQVLADGSSTVATTGSAARARYNLKLASGTYGWVGFKVPASGRSSRVMLRNTMNVPPGPSYQIRRGLRVTYGLQPQTVSGDGTSSGTDTPYSAVSAGSYLFMERQLVSGTPTIIYSAGPNQDGTGRTQFASDTDVSNGGDLWLADAGDSGSGESDLLQVYTYNLVSATS